MEYNTHNVSVLVASASETNQFIIDDFVVATSISTSIPTSIPTSTSISTPASISTSTPSPIVTTFSTPVGPIIRGVVGGVVGGVAGIAILAIALWYFLKRRSRVKSYRSGESSPGSTVVDSGSFTLH